MQTLTGDTCDGFPGCPGIGPVKAKKLIDNVGSEAFEVYNREGRDVFHQFMWACIVAAYAKKGRDAQYALTQARVARILRHDDYDFKTGRPILWEPKTH